MVRLVMSKTALIADRPAAEPPGFAQRLAVQETRKMPIASRNGALPHVGVTPLDRAWEAAASVADPEIPVLSIADLGILHDVRVSEDGKVDVTILPTYMGCPAMGVIRLAIAEALLTAGFSDVAVRLSYSPAWSTDMMSQEARERLRAYGIAPPPQGAGKRALLADDDVDVACPRCGSHTTEKLSEFGSTACKSLWRCTSCREPFEQFKCI
jgi:ring-1,2-phenylacetyl-CoA epoxidase subunit PaaD